MCYITRQRRRRCWRSFPRQSTSAKQFFCRVNIVCIVRDALGTFLPRDRRYEWMATRTEHATTRGRDRRRLTIRCLTAGCCPAVRSARPEWSASTSPIDNSSREEDVLADTSLS